MNSRPSSTHRSSTLEALNAQVTIRGIGADGKEIVLTQTGISIADAMRLAAKKGIAVVDVDGGPPSVDSQLSTRRLAASASFPLLLFSQELLALLEAGLNLTEALSTLLAKERQSAVREQLQRILEALQHGRNFSDVLGMQPTVFPEVYVASIRASERTGDLDKALSRYISYQVQFDEIRKKIVSAAIYPVALLVIGGLVCLFLLGYVVPRFSVVYDSAGRDIPWMSMMLLEVGKRISESWFWVGGVAAAVFIAVTWSARQRQVRRALMERVLRLPWLAVRADEFRLARFYRAISLLLASGIALPRALGMVTGLLNSAQQARLASARQAVNEGQSLSAALLVVQLATPVAESLMKVGERSGQMAEMMERIARFHDDEFARWIDWVSRLLEPVLMALIGLVVGAVVILMYMPIFELAGSLQ